MTQMTLFGDERPNTSVKTLPKRIRDMHAMYGATPGRTCIQCAHFLRYHYGSIWYKCSKSNPTSSASTDWRTRWPACGLFEERYPKSPRTAP